MEQKVRASGEHRSGTVRGRLGVDPDGHRPRSRSRWRHDDEHARPGRPRQAPRGPHEHAGSGRVGHADGHAYDHAYDHADTATRTATDHLPLLALLAPLLLFAHGIVAWVDGLDTLDDASPFGGLGGLGGLAAAHDQGALSVTAGVLLVLSVGGFAWLTAGLGARLRHLPLAMPLAMPTALLAAFGAGATGAVWLGHLTGLLGDTMPSALSSGGAVLTGVALAIVLVALTLEGRLPVGSLALAGLARSRAAPPLGPRAARLAAPAHRSRAADPAGRARLTQIPAAKPESKERSVGRARLRSLLDARTGRYPPRMSSCA